MTGERLPHRTGPALLEPPGVHITKQNSQHVCCPQDKTMALQENVHGDRDKANRVRGCEHREEKMFNGSA